MLDTILALLLTLAPLQGEYLQWGAPGVAIVQSDPVPAGKIWIVRAGGVFTDNPYPADYMMEIVHPVASQGNACCWRIPVMRSPHDVQGTPVLALNREIILFAGDMLSARANNLGNAKFGLTFLYLEIDAR